MLFISIFLEFNSMVIFPEREESGKEGLNISPSGIMGHEYTTSQANKPIRSSLKPLSIVLPIIQI